ncbi:hypothetical protein MTO96_021315 [Rhipicephalus appendiculatus]
MALRRADIAVTGHKGRCIALQETYRPDELGASTAAEPRSTGVAAEPLRERRRARRRLAGDRKPRMHARHGRHSTTEFAFLWRRQTRLQ